MRVSLKAKLTALISVLVLLVVFAICTLYVSHLVRQTLEQVELTGAYIRAETYAKARAVVAESRIPPGTNPADFEAVRRFVQSKLTADAGLRSLMQSAVTYSPTIDYVTITDTEPERKILAHDDPGEIGQTLAQAPALSDLLHTGLFRQLRVIYGSPQVYEVVLPLQMGGQPLCDVRVGVSTVFLAAQVTPQLRAALRLALVVMLLATLSAGLLSFRLLRPLETISQSVDRMARGEFSKPVELNRTDEWGILSSKLNLLGEQIRGEKAAFVALKENLDQLFSNLADGLLLFDNQDRLALATPAVSRFLGRLPEELLHRPAAEIFSDESPLDRLLREAFRARKSLPWQMVDLPAGAKTPRVLSVGVQFVEGHDQTVASLVTLRDASTRAQLEDQLDITAKLAALGRLTSGVAHEVKNPLNAMVLQLEILKSKLEGQEVQVKPQLEILSSEIRRLDGVVRTFLDFTRPVELHRTETDIESLVREVFTLAEPHAQKGNVQLVLEPNGALPPVRMDRDLIKQALLNLVLNGCQAMPSGGQLKVSPHTLPHGVELEISDQGVGIPPEAREKIFLLYFTTKPNGSGVGLAMAYRIIQLHNGSIDFSSEVNRGTTFRVSLPR